MCLGDRMTGKALTLPLKKLHDLGPILNACTEMHGAWDAERRKCAQLQNYDLFRVIQTWWGNSQARSPAMDGYTLFRKDRVGS